MTEQIVLLGIKATQSALNVLFTRRKSSAEKRFINVKNTLI
jgi:hypothetical protein